MTEEKKIAMKTLCERLGRRLNYTVTRAHFAVLMHGWRRRHPEQAPPFSTLRMRKKKDGFLWFRPSEVAHLSEYAGYDLCSD